MRQGTEHDRTGEMTNRLGDPRPLIRRLARRASELAPGIRWHRSRFWTSVVLSRGFESVGTGTVVVAPRKLGGVDRISIGARCAVFEDAWLQCEPGTSGRLEIGDDNYFGHLVHLHAVDDIIIGHNCTFADAVLVNSGRHAPGDRDRVDGAGRIVIGNDVFVGEGVKILGGVTVGDRAVIGAGSVVTRSVAPGTVVAGVPARALHQAER